MKKTLSLLLSLVLMLSLALSASAAETEYPTLEGGVTEIQKYGNIVLDIDPADLKDGGYTYGDLLTVTVNGTGYDMPLCTNYSDVDTGALVLRDSEGVLIAAINMGDFATSNGLAAKVTAEDGSYTWEFPEGQSLESITVSISMKEQGGYYDQYLIHQLTRTDERADYASDAVFANFRNVAVGDLGENAFFRSSSPVNNELGRASYADDLAEAGGIQAVMNLADSNELIEGDFTIADAAGFAQRIGLFPIAYTGTLTQGDLFEMAADALSFSYRDGSATVIGRLVSQGTVSRAAANALGLLTPALTARQVADRCAAAVFRLDTYETEAYRDEGLVTGEASGFFITEDGLAVTNYHSIADAVSATATLSTGDVYEVERVIYYDPDIDIAVIRVSHAALKGHDTSAFATLDIADSGTGDLRAGDTVYAIGNPLGLGLAVSSGIVSATQRDVERYALPCVMSTADISEGSSGGALLNVYGQAVAVTSGAYVYGNSMYLAVPIDPILTADLTGEGLTLPEVLEAETVG